MNIEFFGSLIRYQKEIDEIKNYILKFPHIDFLSRMRIYTHEKSTIGNFSRTCGAIIKSKKENLNELMKIAEEGGIKIYGPKCDKLTELLLYLAETPHKEIISGIEIWVK